VHFPAHVMSIGRLEGLLVDPISDVDVVELAFGTLIDEEEAAPIDWSAGIADNEYDFLAGKTFNASNTAMLVTQTKSKTGRTPCKQNRGTGKPEISFR
jgi:hypothetical protein